MSVQINVAIIDDHKMFLEGISLLVKNMNKDYRVTTFSEPSELLRIVETGTAFDLVICDLIMNAMNGLAFVAALRSQSKSIPVLMLSGINTAPPIDEVRRLGGNGFIHKSADNDTLKRAIRTVLTGGTYFVDGLGGSLIEKADKPRGEGWDRNINMTSVPKLPTRQIEVLRLMAGGATNKDIALSLTISENTVKTHLKQIFLELGVNKRTACVRRAQTLGLI